MKREDDWAGGTNWRAAGMTDADWADHWCDMANKNERLVRRWQSLYWTVFLVAAGSLAGNLLQAFGH